MTMEDHHFILDGVIPNVGLFCVLDGHGGQEVVNYCRRAIAEEF